MFFQGGSRYVILSELNINARCSLTILIGSHPNTVITLVARERERQREREKERERERERSNRTEHSTAHSTVPYGGKFSNGANFCILIQYTKIKTVKI